MPPGSHDGGGGGTFLTGGGGFSVGTGGSAGGGLAGGSTAGGSTAGGSTAGGSTAGGSVAGGSTAGGSAGGSTIDATILVPGQAVRITRMGGGANPQWNYAVTVPSGKTAVVLSLSGGSCTPGSCTGGDVELHLKKGAIPDAFTPDSTTTQFNFTPGGTGTYTKPGAAAGEVWYIGLIDGLHASEYRDVLLTAFPTNTPTCGGSGTACTSASQCCTNQCIPTGPSTKICG